MGFERTRRVKTVFSSEIDDHARKYYTLNFGDEPEGDICSIALDDIPYADIITGGIPCQSFSLAGKMKGLKDERGRLFYRFADIIKTKKPKAFLIENVRNLFIHDKGATFKEILRLLKGEAGYTVYYHIYNSAEWGVPQHRRRVYIVGFRQALPFLFPSSFEYCGNAWRALSVKPLLEEEAPAEYHVSAKTWKRFKRQMKEGVRNGYSGRMLNRDGIAETLCTLPSFKNFLKCTPLPKEERKVPGFRFEKNGEGIRYLMPRELARLQDFPETFVIPKRLKTAARLLGNSVTVRVLEHIAKEMIKTLDRAT